MTLSARLALLMLLVAACQSHSAEADAASTTRRCLCVAEPGINNDLKFGGHGLLIFEIDNGHKFVKRVETHGVDNNGKPLNVKGVCASKEFNSIYVGTTQAVERISLDAVALGAPADAKSTLWEKPYPGGCDRMAIAPDSKFIYLPSFEKDFWNVIDPGTGEIIAKIEPKSGAHNTLISRDGSRAFLAGLHSHTMTVADCKTHTAASTITFSDNVRPFTVNTSGTLVYACVNNLLGFEIGGVASGKMIQRVEVPGFTSVKVIRHGCPSHGVGMTPDEKEVWVADAHNKRVHIFDNTVMPPKYVESIVLRDEPGWIAFTIKGDYAYPSTGDVIDVKSRKIVAGLADEKGAAVQSEKLVEVDFAGSGTPRVEHVEATGDQFGIGRIPLAK